MQIPAEYTKAISRKYPEQVVIALARDERGRCNPISLGWTMTTSGSPPMMAVSVGLTRYSLGVIRRAREFVVSFPSAGMSKEVLFFGAHSGRDMDKLKELGTPTQPATEIDCVLLSEAVANFECRLESELQTGDHVIFVGRVVASHMHENPSVQRVYILSNGHVTGLPGRGD